MELLAIAVDNTITDSVTLPPQSSTDEKITRFWNFWGSHRLRQNPQSPTMSNARKEHSPFAASPPTSRDCAAFDTATWASQVGSLCLSFKGNLLSSMPTLKAQLEIQDESRGEELWTRAALVFLRERSTAYAAPYEITGKRVFGQGSKPVVINAPTAILLELTLGDGMSEADFRNLLKTQVLHDARPAEVEGLFVTCAHPAMSPPPTIQRTEPSTTFQHCPRSGTIDSVGNSSVAFPSPLHSLQVSFANTTTRPRSGTIDSQASGFIPNSSFFCASPAAPSTVAPGSFRHSFAQLHQQHRPRSSTLDSMHSASSPNNVSIAASFSQTLPNYHRPRSSTLDSLRSSGGSSSDISPNFSRVVGHPSTVACDNASFATFQTSYGTIMLDNEDRTAPLPLAPGSPLPKNRSVESLTDLQKANSTSSTFNQPDEPDVDVSSLSPTDLFKRMRMLRKKIRLVYQHLARPEGVRSAAEQGKIGKLPFFQRQLQECEDAAARLGLLEENQVPEETGTATATDETKEVRLKLGRSTARHLEIMKAFEEEPSQCN
jgi:hypothetical protein